MRGAILQEEKPTDISKTQTTHIKEIDLKLFNSLKNLTNKFGIEDIIPIDTDFIVVSEWVHLKCKYGCQRYGKSWCCPPETPGPEKVRNILKEYSTAIILTGKVNNPFFYRNSKKRRRIQVRIWKGPVTIERYLFLKGYYKAFALVSENCALCDYCLYPKSCRFPRERRPSVESFSIDIFATLRRLGRKYTIHKSKNATYQYYSIILLE